MGKVLILGANGQVARYAIDLFIKKTDAKLTLFLRNSSRMSHMNSERIRVLEGDVLNLETLNKAMIGQDVVYANLDGELEQQAKNIVKAMHVTGIKRLILISSMGIYDEVPGEKHGSVLDPYRKSAAVIEASDLDYTILRPAWMNNDDEIDYQITQKGEPFKGSIISRKSIADLIVKLTESPLYVRCNLGLSKP
jgi:uncharacterized protein YbjT (DUF2867 family)